MDSTSKRSVLELKPVEPIVKRTMETHSQLDRSKSEKTVDTTISRGESRSSLYSRNSSRMSLGSSRSLSSKSVNMPNRQSSERSMKSYRRGEDIIRPPGSTQTTPDRRIRKLGYSEEEKYLIQLQAEDAATAVQRKPSRLRKMLSWVARPTSTTSSQSSKGSREEQSRLSSSDDGLGLNSASTYSAHRRSRSAVFVKTPNGLSEGILYR